MAETDIGSSVASDLKTQFGIGTESYFSVDKQSTDASTGQKENFWITKNWTQYLGYYKTIPELRVSIDAKATWTVGKGFKADEITTMTLDALQGWGNDNFNTIMENMIRTYYIAGDSFAEIIRDEFGVLLNLKPLDPSTIQVVVSNKGVILRYEQIAKIAKGSKDELKIIHILKPEKILHLSRNRVADEIHGVSVIEAMENIILARNEAMADWRRVLHRNVDPMWIFHLDTDDTAKIAAFKRKMDKARGEGESMYIPKGAVVPEKVSTGSAGTLNPLPWIEILNDYFYESVGTPKIIIGNSKAFTEASAKIAYLTFQQTVEEEQLAIESELLKQLNLIIEFNFPVSLENELLTDKAKDGPMTAAVPSDTTLAPAAGQGIEAL